MNNLEKNFFENREDQTVIIKRSSQAPEEVRKNPFYDSETWGRAISPDDIYLPDSDEALSFAIATHEIGHLSKEDEIDEEKITLYNFEETKKEEERAWRIGKRYIKECMEKYYEDDEETKQKIEQAINKVEELMMEQFDLSKSMYLEEKPSEDIEERYKEILEQRRRELSSSDEGKEIKRKQEQIKNQKIGIKPDWNRFTNIIKHTVERILEDNKNIKNPNSV